MHCLKKLTRASQYRLFTSNNTFAFCTDHNHFVHPTYTSKYFKIARQDILNYLNEHQMEFKISTNSAQLKQCPFCPRQNTNNYNNQYTLGVNLDNGSYHCFRASCGAKGSWFDFKNFLNGTLNGSQNPDFQPSPNSEKLNLIDYHIYPERLKRKEPREAYEYLVGQDFDMNQRGLTDEVLRLYQVGIDNKEIYDTVQQTSLDAPLVYFPNFRLKSREERNKWEQRALKKRTKDIFEGKAEEQFNPFDSHYYELVSCKIRGGRSDLKYYQRIQPANAVKGIFGLHLLHPEIKQIIITEGEFDAMAAYQMTGIAAISLPNGIGHTPAYLVEWLDQFDKLKDILIWVDDDDAGRLAAQKIAKKFGIARTRVVQGSQLDENYPKDANDALRYYADRVPHYLNQAQCLLKKNITTLSDFKQNTKNRMLNVEQQKGIQSQSFYTYNSTTKGLRQGGINLNYLEFSIITGPTGCGKTTFLSQLSLEFCRKGVTTLWGSFEIKTDRLAEHMLLQNYKTDLIRHPKLIDTAIEKFENEMRMYFMNFYGSTNIESIMDTIEYAVYEYGITHVCLDNLQFMMGTQAQGFKKFDIQDEIIEKFRKLTTNNDIHLSLVIHPRKVDENEDLTIASVFGSAKVTQEADNVYIMQTRPRYRVFEVKKNRFDGEIGRVGLGFDSSLKSYFELTSEEVKILNEEKYTMHQIIEQRVLQGKHFKQEIILQSKNGNGNNGGPSGSPTSSGFVEINISNNFADLQEELEEIQLDLPEVEEEEVIVQSVQQYSNATTDNGVDCNIKPDKCFEDCWIYGEQFKFNLKQDHEILVQVEQQNQDYEKDELLQYHFPSELQRPVKQQIDNMDNPSDQIELKRNKPRWQYGK